LLDADSNIVPRLANLEGILLFVRDTFQTGDRFDLGGIQGIFGSEADRSRPKKEDRTETDSSADHHGRKRWTLHGGYPSYRIVDLLPVFHKRISGSSKPPFSFQSLVLPLR